jgi:hypothetical protein
MKKAGKAAPKKSNKTVVKKAVRTAANQADKAAKSAFEATVSAADQLASKVRRSANPESVLQKSFEDALKALDNNNIAPDAFVPATGGTERLAFARDAKGHKALLDVYLDILRDKLCTKDSELQKMTQAGIHAVTASIVTLVITTLGLSVVAFPIAVPLAAILVTTGMEAFCKWSEPDAKPA